MHFELNECQFIENEIKTIQINQIKKVNEKNTKR